MAVVLVEGGQLHNDQLIACLQMQLALPVMLIARNETSLKGVQAKAQFDADPYLFALLALDDVEWTKLPEPIDPELPF